MGDRRRVSEALGREGPGDRDSGQLLADLRRLGRRLRLRDGSLLAQRSLWLAALAALLIQVAGRLWPVPWLWLWTLAPFALWAAAVVGISLLRPLPAERVARRVDRELGLKERLSTAVELESGPEPTDGPGFPIALVSLQHQDALVTARAIEPRRALPLRWQRRPLGLAALLAALIVVAALLPNPMDAVLEERAGVARAAEEQATALEKLAEQIEESQALSPEDREDLLRQLAELAEELRANPGDREEALAELSKLDEALRRRLDPGAAARQAALESLSAQLQALAQEASQEAAGSDAEALQALAEALANMEPAAQEALARELAALAGEASQAGDGALAQALAALAQAAQQGDAAAAAEAAQAAGQALSQAQSASAAQTELAEALARVQGSRQAIAGAGRTGGQAVAQGEGQGEGQGQGRGQSQSGGPGGGGGTQADSLPPARRTGRAGAPEGEGQAGAVGAFGDQLYVPWERRTGAGEELVITGREGQEGQTQVREQDEPLPGAETDALVPYHEVYYEYLDAASQAMDQAPIPAGLRDYVRDYFSQLEP
jgi:hypothetical protein